MRRLVLVVACCGLLQLAMPAPALAWFEWIDHLSGPGPFNGVDIWLRLKCLPESNAPVNAPGQGQQQQQRQQQQQQQQQSSPDPTLGSKVLTVLGGGCPQGRLFPRSSSFNFKFGYARSYENHLTYAPDVEENRKAVNIWEYEGSFSGWVNDSKTVELTTGVGLMNFRGKAFDSFWRPYWRPVMATIYPASRASGSIRGLNFNVGALLFPMGFEGSDFGAVPGTFHTERDIVVTAGVSYDFTRW